VYEVYDQMSSLLKLIDFRDVCPSMLRAFSKFKELIHQHMPLTSHVIPENSIDRNAFYDLVWTNLAELQYVCTVRTSYKEYRDGLYVPPPPKQRIKFNGLYQTTAALRQCAASRNDLNLKLWEWG